jgi:hypothetical protein
MSAGLVVYGTGKILVRKRIIRIGRIGRIRAYSQGLA